jgi:hypothetical protein
MKPLRRALLAALPLGLAGLLGLAGCQSAPAHATNHWNAGSLGPRFGYHMYGYRHDLSTSFQDTVWENKAHVGRTLARHFLNYNSENPFQVVRPSRVPGRPPISPLPNPVAYLFPTPIDSIAANVAPGGPSEFAEGFVDTFTGDFDRRGEPPPVSEFEVKNKRLPRRR